MTIVVAVTKDHRTVMAADSLTCFGDSRQIPPDNASTSKIRRIGDALVGSAGWAVYDRILDHWLDENDPPDLSDDRAIFAFFLDFWKALHDRYPFVNDQSQGKDSPFGDLDSSFLIASAGGLYKVSHDMDVCRFEQYYAIGSGSEYALGSMYSTWDELDADGIADVAVRAAISYDVQCGGEPRTLALDAMW